MNDTDNSKPSPQLNSRQVSIWDTHNQLADKQVNIRELSQPNSRQTSPISSNNNWNNSIEYFQEERNSREARYNSCPHWFSWCTQGFLLGSLLAGLALAIIIALWLTSKTATTSSATYSTGLSSTANPITFTTTTITTSTLTTSTTSTSTTSTTSTSTASTTSTSTTSTTSISTTSTTSTSTTSTTSTSTASTTSTSTTSTTSTSTTTATPTCATWLWNTTGETVAGFTSSSGSASNLLNSPWNIYVDPTTSILYIADSQNHRIQKWLPGATSGTTIAGTGSSGSSATLLNTPKDVFVDSSQNVYVADSVNNRIQFFPNGSTTGLTVSTSWPTHGLLWGVQVINGSIYACDNSQSTVWNNGSVVAGNHGSGSAANQLNQPQGFAVDTSVAVGTVYAVNSQQHTVVQWAVGASLGSVVAGVDGNPGSTSTQLRYPVSVKLDIYTNMFVVDNNNHRIQLFCRYPTVNLTARTIVGTGSLGATPQTLHYPAGVALDASLNLYVSDTSNHRVQKFTRIV